MDMDSTQPQDVSGNVALKVEESKSNGERFMEKDLPQQQDVSGNTVQIQKDEGISSPSEGQVKTRPYLSIFGQIRLLTKKNWIVKKRGGACCFVLEVGYPLYTLINMAFVYVMMSILGGSSLNQAQFHNQIIPDEREVKEFDYFRTSVPVRVVPDNKAIRNFTEYLKDLELQAQPTKTKGDKLVFEFYNNEAELVKTYKKEHQRVAEINEQHKKNYHFYHSLERLEFLSIIFKQDSKDETILPEYVIRYAPSNGDYFANTNSPIKELSRNKKQQSETCRSESSRCGYHDYFDSHYMELQFLVDKAFILQNQLQGPVNWKAKVRPYPVPASYEKGLQCYSLPFQTFMAFPFFVNNLLAMIVNEKKQKVKDGLKIIGTSELAYWLSWYTLYAIIFGIFSIVYSLAYFLMGSIPLNALIFFILFFLLGISLVSFALALSAFFHSPRTAGFIGTIITIIPATFGYIQRSSDSFSENYFLPFRLFGSYAFVSALDTACEVGSYGTIELSDLQFGGRGGHILYSILFLILDIVLFLFLAIYLDNVIPNSSGVRKSPIFCFMPKFCCRKKLSNKGSDARLRLLGGDISEENEDYEPVPQNMLGTEAIKIRGIGKSYSRFGRKTDVVKSISMDIYANQITAILGKNGAGKSTLFNMLTGIITPTRGTAYILGFDIRDSVSINKLRKMTGVCMQEDIHFPTMTVEEHFNFYGKLRGLKKGVDLEKEVESLLYSLTLGQVRYTRAAKLSGGQKRKLNIGICMIGDPKIVILDEPTAGVDPVSKRAFWSFLQSKKKDRVILLTTHSMEEADILADRKAIINNGELKAFGTSLFLKNRFGAGYYLTVELNDKDMPPESIEAVLNKWSTTSVKSKTTAGNEIKYPLPYSAVPNFPSLFSDLEKLKNDTTKNIQSYGISMTSLEEVFLKICSDADVVQPQSNGNGILIEENNTNFADSLSNEQDIKKGALNTLRILYELCKLRIRRLYRKPFSIFGFVICPILMMLLVLGLPQINSIRTPKSVKFSDNDFYLSGDMNVALYDENNNTTLSQFLSNNGVNVTNYDGHISSLLQLNQPKGTIAAININFKDIKDLEFTLQFNASYEHAAPIIVNLVDRYLSSIPKKQLPSKLSVTSKPFEKTEDKTIPDVIDIVALLIFGFTFMFIPLGFILELVYDKEVQVKSQLRINGVSLKMYFISMLSVYGGLHAIVITVQMCMVYGFRFIFFTNMNLFWLTTILFYFCIIPSLLFSAVISYLFKTVEAASIVFIIIYYLIGYIIPFLAIMVIYMLQTDIPHYIISVIDIFYIPYGILYYVATKFFKCSADPNCNALKFGHFFTVELWSLIIIMSIQSVIFTYLLYLSDLAKQGRGRCCVDNTRPMPVHPWQGNDNAGVDSDVGIENNKVDNYFANPSSFSSVVIAAQKVTKWFKTIKNFRSTIRKLAVNNVSLLMEDGVFGLLGHNGAGKSTFIKILMSDERPDSGKVRICGFEIENNLSQAFKFVGYCPQNDALWETITMKEHLELFGAIRGLSCSKAKDAINKLMVGLKIQEHSKKKSENLSGGTKRKLCYAISVIGFRKAVLLDEPSTGLDPQSKRHLWNTIRNAFTSGRCALLTTHSMEEADALCNKIAIMDKGSFMCIGSPQHLKAKFGSGYTMEIRIPEPLDEEVEVFLMNSILETKRNQITISSEFQQPGSPYSYQQPPGPGSPYQYQQPPGSPYSYQQPPGSPYQYQQPPGLPYNQAGSPYAYSQPPGLPYNQAGSPYAYSQPPGLPYNQPGVPYAQPQQPDSTSADLQQPISTEPDLFSPFRFVEDSFPGSRLTECFSNRAVFSVPVTAVQSISSCFSLLESWKAKGTIIDYSFSQTTLEQVFLDIAKLEVEEAEVDQNP